MGVKVESSITLYEMNGERTCIGTVKVKSHHTRRDLVLLDLTGLPTQPETFAVSISDLRRALAAAEQAT